jgi:hypothetical protein
MLNPSMLFKFKEFCKSQEGLNLFTFVLSVTFINCIPLVNFSSVFCSTLKSCLIMCVILFK